MCDPLTISLILTAAGAGTQAVNNNIAMRRQDREAARGIRKQGELQREANNRVNQQIDELAASDGSTERADALAGFQNAIRETADSAHGSLPGDALLLGANPRFAEKVSQGQTQIRQGADESADRLAIIDAAVAQRMNEGSRMGRTATDLSETKRRSAAEDFINQLRINERRPNEWVEPIRETHRKAARTFACISLSSAFCSSSGGRGGV